MISEAAKGNTATGTETVGDLLTQWLDHSESLGRSPTTMKKYRQMAEAVVPAKLGEDQAVKADGQRP